MIPAVCWYTPCTPQKQPPARTAVWMPSAFMSVAGAGMMTASSAAREGAMAKAAIASALSAAAHNERRLNWLRGMVSSWGRRVGGSLERGARFANQRGSPDVPRYAPGVTLLPASSHEFVNKKH